MKFSDSGIDQRLLRAIEHLGFEQMTEIQAEAIPTAVAGRDLMATSQTGTGKTIAFALPMLHRLMHLRRPASQDPRGLILAPTRELALQVFESVRYLSMNTMFKPALIVGRESMQAQEKILSRRPDILVATPGRLLDHCRAGTVKLDHVQVLVLDEADRMLDLGFSEDVLKIAGMPNKAPCQKMLFSATLDDKAIEEIADKILDVPERIEISKPKQEHAHIEQRLYFSDHLDQKNEQLKRIVEQEEFRQMIVFTATKSDTIRLTEMLNQGYGERELPAAALHGDMLQNQRKRTIDQFRRGHYKILVATDVAARGLDISTVSHVVNFDLPVNPEDYIHRIGRSGRSGDAGLALSLVGPKDWNALQRIEAFLERKMTYSELPGLVAKFKGFKKGQQKRFQGKKKFGQQAKLAAQGDRPVRRKPRKVSQEARRKHLKDNISSAVDAGHLPMKRMPRVDNPDTPEE